VVQPGGSLAHLSLGPCRWRPVTRSRPGHRLRSDTNRMLFDRRQTGSACPIQWSAGTTPAAPGRRYRAQLMVTRPLSGPHEAQQDLRHRGFCRSPTVRPAQVSRRDPERQPVQRRGHARRPRSAETFEANHDALGATVRFRTATGEGDGTAAGNEAIPPRRVECSRYDTQRIGKGSERGEALRTSAAGRPMRASTPV